MKPQISHRVTSQNVFTKQLDMGSIKSLKVLLSCGTEAKICYIKIYPPGKLKQLLVIFTLNHINSLLILQKIDLDM